MHIVNLLTWLPCVQLDLPPQIKTAAGHLRRYAEYHMTNHPVMSKPQAEAELLAASKELLDYAVIAERVGIELM